MSKQDNSWKYFWMEKYDSIRKLKLLINTNYNGILEPEFDVRCPGSIPGVEELQICALS